MAVNVVFQQHSSQAYNDIYKTPTWRTVPMKFIKELMLTPRKKKGNVPARRLSAPATFNDDFCHVRKRLDFDGIDDTKCATKRKIVKAKGTLNHDPEDLPVPFVQLQVSPRLSKKVKFSDDTKEINSYVSTPTKSNWLSRSTVNSEYLPLEQVIPLTDACEESSQKYSAELGKTPDWDSEFVTPKPKAITDTPREETGGEIYLRTRGKSRVSNATLGKSVRSLSFQ